ncbi:fibronectin type III domain-containing protein [Streptomyces poriticola]|uniref:fibronectin type III domain-containing protein n=1 Tax=Streptomyces poriticola TaxID=3120506 RepID=UPI002FCE4BA5
MPAQTVATASTGHAPHRHPKQPPGVRAASDSDSGNRYDYFVTSDIPASRESAYLVGLYQPPSDHRVVGLGRMRAAGEPPSEITLLPLGDDLVQGVGSSNESGARDEIQEDLGKVTFDSLYGRLPGDTSASEPMWPSLADRDLVGSRSHGDGIPDRQAIPTWDTDTSPVELVDLDAAMSCDPTATICATAYDGLHPNKVGEVRIAQRFSAVLHEEFGMGSEALVPPLPGSDSDRSVTTPTGLEFDGTRQGVTVTRPKVFGAHGYDVQWRDVTDDSAADWQDSLPGAESNRWDLSRQFTNQPWSGHTYEVGVRSVAGDVESSWSDPVSGVARPTTAPPPADILVAAGEGSVDVRWTAPPAGPHTGSITRYALWIWDEDTPLVHSRVIGYPASARTTHVTGLTPGHRYRVFMCTWKASGEGKPRVAGTVLIPD